MKSITIYLGLGSNLGHREASLRYALRLLSTNVKIEKISPIYDTAPIGNTEQPRFLNVVCKGTTLLSPSDLLTYLKSIEKQMGRVSGPRNSPRPIDIDILFYGDFVVETPELVIPHSRLQERAFVLAPLKDIAPKLKHPINGKTVSRLLRELKRTKGDAVKRLESGGAMYEITVEKDFDAAHFLRGYQGKCEALHGHRFKVAVTVKTDKLNDIGLGYDFTELKQKLGEVLSRFDHTCLNEIAPFKRINPSSENIATTIYRELKRKLKATPAVITAIEVWESPQSRITYRPD